MSEDTEDVIDVDESNDIIPVTYAITAYGADYPVDGLVRRMLQGDIIVPQFDMQASPDHVTAGFQRQYVWKKSQADHFIESLLLGLPVPGIFLVKEPNGKHLVLDGQQRLKSLANFYEGTFNGKVYELENVQEQWKRQTYKSLPPDDRRRLDDSIIHATIVRQDEPTEDQSSIYLIFERLNSGGTFLQPQEIRVALYHGKYARLLSELNDNTLWRELYGKKSIRLKDLELILRFFALFYNEATYSRPMKDFLNRSLMANRNLTRHSESELRHLFEETIKTIHKQIGTRAFRRERSVNAALFDSVMVGVATRLQKGGIISVDRFKEAYDILLLDKDYAHAISQSTANDEIVRQRLKIAKDIFDKNVE